MYNIKIFPSATTTANAPEVDKAFLEELKRAKAECGANYVNFSIYNYKGDEPETVHFITYPTDWITHYVQSQYMESDPLLKLDYRRILYLDWEDIQNDPQARELFGDFNERGLGNHGLTIVGHIDANMYGVVHYCFMTDDEQWRNFKADRMEALRTLGDRLGRQYQALYNNSPAREYKITKRESECLYWVAVGKTDDEIAEILLIGKWTVVGHLKSAKHKLGCPNRASAVATAISLEIIDMKKPPV